MELFPLVRSLDHHYPAVKLMIFWAGNSFASKRLTHLQMELKRCLFKLSFQLACCPTRIHIDTDDAMRRNAKALQIFANDIICTEQNHFQIIHKTCHQIPFMKVYLNQGALQNLCDLRLNQGRIMNVDNPSTRSQNDCPILSRFLWSLSSYCWAALDRKHVPAMSHSCKAWSHIDICSLFSVWCTPHSRPILHNKSQLAHNSEQL